MSLAWYFVKQSKYIKAFNNLWFAIKNVVLHKHSKQNSANTRKVMSKNHIILTTNVLRKVF